MLESVLPYHDKVQCQLSDIAQCTILDMSSIGYTINDVGTTEALRVLHHLNALSGLRKVRETYRCLCVCNYEHMCLFVL